MADEDWEGVMGLASKDRVDDKEKRKKTEPRTIRFETVSRRESLAVRRGIGRTKERSSNSGFLQKGL